VAFIAISILSGNIGVKYIGDRDKIEILTALCVCVCPTSIKMLEQMIERQKLIRMIDLSDLMYLKRNGISKLHSPKSAMA